jgi:hypothetical protein
VDSKAFPPSYAELLHKYVTPDGVRYAAWHENPEDLKKLDEVVNFYATMEAPPISDAASQAEALAWNLNAYNAWILHNILQKYPTKGPLAGDLLFFRKNQIYISGRLTTFNDLEQNVIRPTFKDARVHFAINCASMSCPPLHVAPFDSLTLNQTLESLATAFINGKAVQMGNDGKTVSLSRIFEWYAEDFGGKENVIDYLNHYRVAKLSPALPIKFMNYDWSLNEAR